MVGPLLPRPHHRFDRTGPSGARGFFPSGGRPPLVSSSKHRRRGPDRRARLRSRHLCPGRSSPVCQRAARARRGLTDPPTRPGAFMHPRRRIATEPLVPTLPSAARPARASTAATAHAPAPARARRPVLRTLRWLVSRQAMLLRPPTRRDGLLPVGASSGGGGGAALRPSPISFASVERWAA